MELLPLAVFHHVCDAFLLVMCYAAVRLLDGSQSKEQNQ